MNCCNEYGECRQGRDCPVRMKKQESKNLARTWLDFIGFLSAALIGCWLGWMYYISVKVVS